MGMGMGIGIGIAAAGAVKPPPPPPPPPCFLKSLSTSMRSASSPTSGYKHSTRWDRIIRLNHNNKCYLATRACTLPAPSRQVHTGHCSFWLFLWGNVPPGSLAGPPHSVCAWAGKTRPTQKLSIKVHSLYSNKFYLARSHTRSLTVPIWFVLHSLPYSLLYLAHSWSETYKRNEINILRGWNIVHLRYLRVKIFTILSSVTSDCRRGAAQIRVDTASWRPGSSSLWGRRKPNSISLIRPTTFIKLDSL